ncbi:hypothetical protein LZZ85_11345 [Terrimonas sp. NA20]|uniref:Uncharacterized protein n=1 Tax=Terrimonas ginsenosidimutans TaxID=2908004 RepID=A0ABS9KRC6_9BACT|nr:hypothetical protein [Terrimonas ginsenosidimutans]MCG2614883.1 hypothetical protein [Terrimonas ginsenosidimutans]
MFTVKAKLDTKVFREARWKLSDTQIRQALRMSLNDAVIKGRTMVRRSAQEVYNVKASAFNDKSNKKGLTLDKATTSKLTARIIAGHTPIRLSDMNPKYEGKAVATQVKYNKKTGKAQRGKVVKRSTSQISVEIIKGKRKTLGSAFTIGIAKHAQSGNQFATTAIFARGKKGKPGFEFGKSRYPIDSMSAISVATSVMNKKTLGKYDRELNKYASDRFEHHVKRLVKKADGLSS